MEAKAYHQIIVGFPVGRHTFLIEGVLDQKTYLAKLDVSAQKPRGRHLLQAVRAVSECPCHARLVFDGGTVCLFNPFLNSN